MKHAGTKAADAAKGIHAVIASIHSKIPKAKILLLAILPSGQHQTIIHETNQLLAKEVKASNATYLHYLDMSSHFESRPGHFNASLYLPDRIHLLPHGYEIWHAAMKSTYDALLA